MKKFLIIFVILSVVFSISHAITAKGISNVEAKVTPTDRNSYGEWKISFTIGKELKTGYDYIYIQFPQEMVIPCTSCAYAHCQDCFKINGANAAGAGYVENYKNAIYLRVPGITLNAGQRVEVFISQSAQFQNPSIPGKYTLKVWTSQEPEKIISNEFEITSTKIENLAVSVDPEFTNAKTKVSITFTTGRLGNIQNGKFVYIKFPEEFTLPQVIRQEFVTVNTENPTEARIDGKILALKIASSIGNYRDVTINIYSSFGILNPSTKGTYTFTVWTDSEIEPVTATVEVKEKDFVRTLIQTNPIEPNGNNGFFKSPVTVTLIGETNTSESIQTFYKVDEGEYQTYTAPFQVQEGIHTITYFSKTNKINEDAQIKVIKIDLTAPSIVLDFNDSTFTSESSFVISGKVSEKSSLYIKGEIANVKDDLSFAKEFSLEDGPNDFTIKATDIAGNTAIKQIVVYMDTTTPVLTIESPSANWQKFKGTGIEVKGSVYPENCNIYVNDNKVALGSDGKFAYIYTPKKGETLIAINITAVYSLTGKSAEKKFIVTFEPQATEIMLTIGKKEIISNGKISLMDTAPFIDKASSRTLVPIRFVSEIFGFEVSWNSETKEVTIKSESKTIILKIGSKTAYVDGKPFEIDVAPVIKDSRTFVPLRFISEVLGFNVDWDGTTQTIKISR